MALQPTGSAAWTWRKPLVFISYSHNDLVWAERVALFVKALEWSGLCFVWLDRDLRHGELWQETLGRVLERCAIAIPLISPDYLASGFIREIELPAILDRRARANLTVLPIVARPCAWQAVPGMARLQVAPRDDEALSLDYSSQPKYENFFAKFVLDLAATLGFEPDNDPKRPGGGQIVPWIKPTDVSGGESTNEGQEGEGPTHESGKRVRHRVAKPLARGAGTGGEVIRYIDTIARDKDIDREALFEAVEQSMAQALSKKYGVEDLQVTLDRDTGELECNYEVSFESEGRVTAQAVKQAIISKVREQERDVLYSEFETEIGKIATGTVEHFEGDAVIVNLGRNMEGILPRNEKVRGELHNIGNRIRSMVLEVKKAGPRVKIPLTRGHKDLVRCLFQVEVPEICERTMETRRIELELGYRKEMAVHSSDKRVDCVGAGLGVRGTQTRSIIEKRSKERIDIIHWNADPEGMIKSAFKPADNSHIQLDSGGTKALALVDGDQFFRAIGRTGQSVRLASRLTHWETDIMTRIEYGKPIVDTDVLTATRGLAVLRFFSGTSGSTAENPASRSSTWGSTSALFDTTEDRVAQREEGGWSGDQATGSGVRLARRRVDTLARGWKRIGRCLVSRSERTDNSDDQRELSCLVTGSGSGMCKE